MFVCISKLQCNYSFSLTEGVGFDMAIFGTEGGKVDDQTVKKIGEILMTTCLIAVLLS